MQRHTREAAAHGVSRTSERGYCDSVVLDRSHPSVSRTRWCVSLPSLRTVQRVDRSCIEQLCAFVFNNIGCKLVASLASLPEFVDELAANGCHDTMAAALDKFPDDNEIIATAEKTLKLLDG